MGLGAYRLAKACLRWAASHHRQHMDGAALARRRSARPRRPPPDLLTADEVAALIAAAAAWHPANAAIAHLVATYGHRPESLVGLDGKAVEGDRLTIPVKGGDTVRHPLLPQSLAILRVLDPTAGQPLFVGHLGRPWTDGREFASWWHHQVGQSVNPRCPGIYHLKRYAISRMLAAGVDLATVASITGHRTPAILLRYARTNEQRQAAALAALSAEHPGSTPSPEVVKNTKKKHMRPA